MKVKAILDANISEPGSDSDLLPFKVTSDIPFNCWPYNHLHNFTEFVAFTVFWKDNLSYSEDSCEPKEFTKMKIIYLKKQ